MTADLRGRGAIVTGGAGVLGRNIVAGLQAAGCRTVVLDMTVAASPGVVGIPCDLADPDSTEAAIAKAWEEAGPISILVNAVGSIRNSPLINVVATGDRRHSFDAWREVIDANLTTVFLATVNQVNRMVATRTRGVVVSLSSVAAAGNAGQGAYSAAKAGVNAVTAAWAKELGALGIRFVSVAPGFIDVESTRAALSEAVVKDWTRKTPLRRFGTVDEVTAAVMFTIENEYLNGKVVEIDGGLVL